MRALDAMIVEREEYEEARPAYHGMRHSETSVERRGSHTQRNHVCVHVRVSIFVDITEVAGGRGGGRRGLP